MRFAWISALKDLRRLRREPVTLLTWIAIPSFLAVVITLVFGPRGAQPHGTLLHRRQRPWDRIHDARERFRPGRSWGRC